MSHMSPVSELVSHVSCKWLVSHMSPVSELMSHMSPVSELVSHVSCERVSV